MGGAPLAPNLSGNASAGSAQELRHFDTSTGSVQAGSAQALRHFDTSTLRQAQCKQAQCKRFGTPAKLSASRLSASASASLVHRGLSASKLGAKPSLPDKIFRHPPVW